jgi:drug/metabolite transporter (DMT)-like permease
VKPRDLLELLLLAAIWGASFLFMRVAVPQFGAFPLVAVRVLGATLVLLPLLAWRGELGALRARWKPIAWLALFNSALPFLCFSYAALHITGGLSSIFNAATPLFTALIAWLWLHERLTRWRVLGLAIGLAGVVGLAWNKAGLHSEGSGALLAVLACLGAAGMYGYSANFTRRHLQGVPSMALATGTQAFSALVLLGPALASVPAQAPSPTAWAAAVALAVLCSGVAYVLYFRLIAHIGSTHAASVTFLIPLFAVAWGALLLAEPVTPAMAIGAAVILAGTALAMGLLPRSRAAPG